MIGGAVDSEVEDIIGETFYYDYAALCALDGIKQTGLSGIETRGSLSGGSPPLV